MSNAMMFSQYEYKAPTSKKVWSHFCTLISCELITLSSKLFKDIGFSKGGKWLNSHFGKTNLKDY